MGGLMIAWLTVMGVSSYRYVKQNGTDFPPPYIYTQATLVYAGLAAIGESSPEAGKFATVFGWGLVVAAVATGTLSVKSVPAQATSTPTQSTKLPMGIGVDVPGITLNNGG